MAVEVYGEHWESAIAAEIAAIQRGGHWKRETSPGSGKWDKKIYGLGLYQHYKKLQSLLWPWKGWDRWAKLILRNLLKNRLTLLVGPNSSGKSHNVAAFIVTRYIVFPHDSCALVSSTTLPALQLKIWGEIKKLWSEAKLRYEGTPGRIVESEHLIVTDIEDMAATDYRNGIIAIPCKVGGNYQGLGAYAGIKNGKVFLAADELSFMPEAFYDAIMTLTKNRDFKCAGMFNPKDRTDVAGKLAEPSRAAGGWEAYHPTGKTYTWETRFPGGVAIQLDGRDSPNNDVDEGEPFPYWYLINRDQIASDVAYRGAEDWHIYMNCYGIFPSDAQARRVITRMMCDRFRAFEQPVWEGELTGQFTLDAAYGAVGGDRCVGIETAWGKCTDGKVRLAAVGSPVLIPVQAALDISPEDQIATWVKEYCERKKIPPSHVGFDSTGRGSLVSAFARLWSAEVVAIEFGGTATDRPLPTKLRDQKNNVITCYDYYDNFMSEMWFAWPTLVEADQCRALPQNVVDEGVMRGWDYRGRKIQVEPKDDFKKRLQKSPDLADSWVVAIELARRLGMDFAGIVVSAASGAALMDLLQRDMEAARERRNRHQLVYR